MKRAKLTFPLGSDFFDEVKSRGITEIRQGWMQRGAKFTAGPTIQTMPMAVAVLTAFDQREDLVIEAEGDLDIAYFEDQVKTKQEKIVAWVKEQAEKRGLGVKEGRWVPA